MKPQYPCLAMCAMPGLPGYWWRAEDGVRLLRIVIRPVLIAAVITAVAATLLLGGRSLAPFVIGVGNPAQMATMSQERASAERELRAEAEVLLASFESSAPAAPTTNGELP